MGDVIRDSLDSWYHRADQDVETTIDFCMDFEVDGLTMDTTAYCEE